MKNSIMKYALLSFICLSLCPLGVAEEIQSFTEREISIPIFVRKRYPERIFVNDISIVYPESFLRKGIQAMVKVEYELGEGDVFKKTIRTMTYQLYGYKYRYDRVIYKAVADFERKEPGFKEFEHEVLRALSKSTFKAEKKIDGSRKEVSNFYFDKNNVYARTFTRSQGEALITTAKEAFQEMNLEIENMDVEQGVIRSKITSKQEGKRRSDFFIIMKIENNADAEGLSEIKAVMVVRYCFPPYEEGRKFFRIIFPYHETLIDLLRSMVRRLNDEDSRVEFMSPRKSVQRLFPIEGLRLEDMHPDAPEDLDEERITSPKMIKKSKSDLKYPQDLLHEYVEGFIILSAVIGCDGLPKDIEIVSVMPEDRGLEEATIAASSAWKYKPALKDGKPIKVIMTTAIKFYIR